jgi:hypothetical protein
LDSADAWAVTVDPNPHVALLSPVCTPRIFNNVIILAVLGSEAHCGNCMVLGCAASDVGDDSHDVVLEGVRACADCHGDRLLGDGSFELLHTVFRDFGEVNNVDCSVVLRPTLISPAGIWILCLCIHLFSFLGVTEAVFLIPSSASVLPCTVKALLLGKLDERT